MGQDKFFSAKTKKSDSKYKTKTETKKKRMLILGTRPDQEKVVSIFKAHDWNSHNVKYLL